MNRRISLAVALGLTLCLSPALAEEATGLVEEVLVKGELGALSRPLTDRDLEGLSPAQLRILRNTVFAKYGRRFKSEDLSAHFARFDWYQAKSDTVDASLTPIEKENVALIRLHEHPAQLLEARLPATLESCWSQESGSGHWGEDIQLLPLLAGGKIQGESTFASDTLMVTHTGTWKRQGEKLLLKWRTRVVEDVPGQPTKRSAKSHAYSGLVRSYVGTPAPEGRGPEFRRAIIELQDGEALWRCALCFRGPDCGS